MTVWGNISSEAAGEFWSWSLSVKGLTVSCLILRKETMAQWYYMTSLRISLWCPWYLTCLLCGLARENCSKWQDTLNFTAPMRDNNFPKQRPHNETWYDLHCVQLNAQVVQEVFISVSWRLCWLCGPRINNSLVYLNGRQSSEILLCQQSIGRAYTSTPLWRTLWSWLISHGLHKLNFRDSVARYVIKMRADRDNR